jgi:hypothetical protein
MPRHCKASGTRPQTRRCRPRCTPCPRECSAPPEFADALARLRQAGITFNSRAPWPAPTLLNLESTSRSCDPIGRLTAASSSPSCKHPTGTPTVCALAWRRAAPIRIRREAGAPVEIVNRIAALALAGWIAGEKTFFYVHAYSRGTTPCIGSQRPGARFARAPRARSANALPGQMWRPDRTSLRSIL